MNIVDLIFARSSATHPAVVSPELQLTFSELKARMTDCAQRLNAAPNWPQQQRPRIGLNAPSGADYIVVALAILQQNACFVPIPNELTASERAHLAKATALDVIVHAQSALEWRVEAVAHDSPPAFDETALAALNPAFIRFSSGTTGTSKGIVISHETLLARITAANAGLCIGPQDRVLWVLPMAHHFAVSIVLYLYYGATTILAPASDPQVMLDMMQAHGATVMYGSPYHYTMLSGLPDAACLGALRLAVSTAFALTQEVAELFAEKTGLHLTQGMGIIEAGLPILNLQHAKDKPTSIGQPLPEFEVKLDDGELMLRGQKYQIDCVEGTNKSWGPRNDWVNKGATWVHIHLDDDFSAFFVLGLAFKNKEVVYGPFNYGYISSKGKRRPIVDAKMTAQRLDMLVTRATVELTDDQGKTYVAHGTTLSGAPWYSFNPASAGFQTLMRWECDGRTGHSHIADFCGMGFLTQGMADEFSA